MSDAASRTRRLTTKLEKIKKSLDLDKKSSELLKFEKQAADPNFWNDQQNARAVMQKIGDLNKSIGEVGQLERQIKDLLELSNDSDLEKEVLRDIKKVERELDRLTKKTYLSGEYDSKNAIVSIHAGQGGVEAMDWASMLLRMYLRFTEKKGWKTDVVEKIAGEEAGIKSVTLSVKGAYAYGHLKKEMGTHRLVRLSPFNADNLRQTSFALVEVLPEFEEIDLPGIQIKDEDLEWQFFRASGQGGQNVQKVNSAVRLTHTPTKIVVTAQTERYQEQNRKYALNLLRAKLWAKKLAEQHDEKKKVTGEYTPATWGTQIRSYVLHPYKMVKDLRTNVETSDTEAVLDGDLDQFIEAQLRLKS